MIRAVVFDLDDTLAPEYGFIKSGFKAVSGEIAKKHGVKAADEIFALLLELFDENAKNVFNRVFEALGIDYADEDICSLVKLYREHETDGELYGLYPDVLPVLLELRDRGIKLGVLTDGFAVSQKNKLKALGIDEVADGGIFDCIVVTALKGEGWGKPSEKGFLYMAERMGVSCGEMLYVGDNPKKDFYVKSAIPIKTARIMREGGVYLDAEYMKGVKEDFRLEGMEGIYAYI